MVRVSVKTSVAASGNHIAVSPLNSTFSGQRWRVEITLDRQVVSERCSDCEVDFTVVRGSVYDAGQPFALYLIALHGHSPEGQLAHLALGTANMLARDLKLPRDPEGVAELVESGATRRIDLGRIGERRFVGNVGVGFDALIVREIGRTRRGVLGYRSYVGPILRSLADYRPPQLEVRIDGEEPRACSWVIVSNLRNYGGLFEVSDRAGCDSGRLELCVFERARRTDLVRYFVAGMRGRLTRARGVSFHAARRVRISGDEVPVQVDGDTWGTTAAELEIQPAAASILVPTDARAD